MVTSMLTIMEGGDDQICATVSEDQPAHERMIVVNFPEVILGTMFTGTSHNYVI